MDEVARLAPRDRSDLFRAAAEAMGVTVPVIEKDFWVCWVLSHLFTLEDFSSGLTFKGGTSLSKVFGAIERMSEDIDLVIDRAGLGFTGKHDPAAEAIGGHERARRLEALKKAAADFVAGPLANALRSRVRSVLGADGSWSLDADVSNLDNPLLNMRYPSIEPPSGYLRPMIRLELGARGQPWPSVAGTVTPYAAERFPAAFRQPTAAVRALSPERTFWEKVTILHALAHQDAARAKRAKPARHSYDVCRLWQRGIGQTAVGDHELLADVVRHKATFFRDPKARYELAVPGSLRLVPAAEIAAALRPDYESMAEEMIFGVAPSFDKVMAVLAEIEAAVNG
jgi:hypothetical protein